VFGLGCDEAFAPPSSLSGPRVLALSADALELGPGQTTQITPTVYLPAAFPTKSELSFCPVELGSRTGFQCVASGCEERLSPDAEGKVLVDPSASLLRCATLLQESAFGGGTGGSSPALPSTISAVFRYRLLEDAAGTGGQAPLLYDEAVLRLSLSMDGPVQAPNTPPVIQSSRVRALSQSELVGLGTGAREGLAIEVEVDPTSLQRYQQLGAPEASKDKVEEAIVAAFVTQGELTQSYGFGLSTRFFWTPDAAAGAGTAAPAYYIVLRDSRGAQSALGPLPLTP